MIAYKISKNARILFVEINPHLGSNRRGVPFSNNKMFWYLLNQAAVKNHPALQAKSSLLHREDRVQRILQQPEMRLGWQTEIGDTRIYLMHFPIRGPALVRAKELSEVEIATDGILCPMAPL
jgi:hypothetical protein